MSQPASATGDFVRSSMANNIAIGLSCLFALLSLLFLGRGIQQLLPAHSATNAKDLHQNWTELRVVRDHESPYAEVYTPPSPYPPFVFVTNGLLYWPAWSLARIYFAGINLICLAGFMVWAFFAVRGSSTFPIAVASALSVTAISAIATGLGLGQNSIYFLSLLLICLILYRRGQRIAVGIVLGIALAKINISLPFAIPFLFWREWKILIIAALYTLVGTLAVGWWVHTSAAEMIHGWMIAAQGNSAMPYGPASLLTLAGLSPAVAIKISAVVFLSAALVVFGLLRNLSPMIAFGLASGFGRLWTYHRVYDNFMLVFLLIALLQTGFRKSSRLCLAAAMLLGLTLWPPIHSFDVTPVHIVHVLIWIGAMVVLAAKGRATDLAAVQVSNSSR